MFELQMTEFESDSNTVVIQQQSYVPVAEVFPGFAENIRKTDYPSSVTLFIIIALAIYAAIKYNFGKNLLDAFQALLNYRQAWRMFEDRRETDKQAVTFLNILFFLTVGIFVSITLSFFETSLILDNYTVSILFFSLASFLIYIIKSYIWRAFGAIFMVQLFSHVYTHTMFLYNGITGLIVFPLIAIIPFVSGIIVPYIIYVIIGIFVLSYLFRLFRFFQIIFVQNVSILHFFLYLCALEILPLLLFAKGCKMLSEFVL